MFRESNLGVRVFASEGALRHLDGSIDFDAYRERARRARAAAIAASVTGSIRIVGAALSSIAHTLVG